jgi:hypothetical protein
MDRAQQRELAHRYLPDVCLLDLLHKLLLLTHHWDLLCKVALERRLVVLRETRPRSRLFVHSAQRTARDARSAAIAGSHCHECMGPDRERPASRHTQACAALNAGAHERQAALLLRAHTHAGHSRGCQRAAAAAAGASRTVGSGAMHYQ